MFLVFSNSYSDGVQRRLAVAAPKINYCLELLCKGCWPQGIGGHCRLIELIVFVCKRHAADAATPTVTNLRVRCVFSYKVHGPIPK